MEAATSKYNKNMLKKDIVDTKKIQFNFTYEWYVSIIFSKKTSSFHFIVVITIIDWFLSKEFIISILFS